MGKSKWIKWWKYWEIWRIFLICLVTMALCFAAAYFFPNLWYVTLGLVFIFTYIAKLLLNKYLPYAVEVLFKELDIL
jgi:hypothetical protein